MLNDHIRDPNGAKLSKWSIQLTIQPILGLLYRFAYWFQATIRLDEKDMAELG